MFKVAIVCMSDKGAKGKREDISTQIIEKIMLENNYLIEKKILIPDDFQIIKDTLLEICENNEADLILTTGGTGFSKRDITPEATEEVIEKRVPGIPEAIRSYSLNITKRAMLSRATAGIRKNTLIINMPGSPKAVEEALSYIIPELKHGLEIMIGSATDCART